MRKYVIALVGLVLLTGCTSKDKNIVLSEDTSNDINSKYEVKVDIISEKFKDDEIGTPGFYENESLYLLKGKLDTERVNLVTSEIVKYDLNSNDMGKVRGINLH